MITTCRIEPAADPLDGLDAQPQVTRRVSTATAADTRPLKVLRTSLPLEAKALSCGKGFREPVPRMFRRWRPIRRPAEPLERELKPRRVQRVLGYRAVA